MNCAPIDIESMTLEQLRELFCAVADVFDRRSEDDMTPLLDDGIVDLNCMGSATVLDQTVLEFISGVWPVQKQAPFWDRTLNLCDELLVDLSQVKDRRSLADICAAVGVEVWPQ